jgi:hypothetical protein
MTTPSTHADALPDRPRGGAATWYEVLDVGPGASAAELRDAWERSLALVEGRTLGGYFLLDPLAVASARADIEAAWAVLSDPDRRAAYDRALGLPPSTTLPSPAAPPTGGPVLVPRTPSLRFLAPVDEGAAASPPTTATNPTATTATNPTATNPMPTTATTTATNPTVATTATTATNAALPRTSSPATFPAAFFALEGEVNGQVLKKLREARGLTLDELAELTKIRRPYLQAIEEQDLENLPSRVFLRGFLTQIGRALRVDKTRLAEGYVAFVDRFRR